jgi:hypothetical protein
VLQARVTRPLKRNVLASYRGDRDLIYWAYLPARPLLSGPHAVETHLFRGASARACVEAGRVEWAALQPAVLGSARTEKGTRGEAGCCVLLPRFYLFWRVRLGQDSGKGRKGSGILFWLLFRALSPRVWRNCLVWFSYLFLQFIHSYIFCHFICPPPVPWKRVFCFHAPPSMSTWISCSLRSIIIA